jgi:hypothetical protein
VRIRIALAAGLLVIATTIVLALNRVPPTVARVNLPLTHTTLISTSQPAAACQTGELLPARTTAIRLGLTTNIGSRVTVKVFSGSRVVTGGEQTPGWHGASVTVPLRALSRAVPRAKVCFRLSDLNAIIQMLGVPTGRAVAAVDEGQALPGRMRIEYLRAGRTSWWSMATEVARRLGLGRAAGGTWNALLVLALATLLVALSTWLVSRELR